jgi:hypothetical protein
MKISQLSSNFENRLSFYLKDESSGKDFWVEFFGIHKAWITIPSGQIINSSYKEKVFDLVFKDQIPQWTKKHSKIGSDIKNEVENFYGRISKLKCFL